MPKNYFVYFYEKYLELTEMALATLQLNVETKEARRAAIVRLGNYLPIKQLS